MYHIGMMTGCAQEPNRNLFDSEKAEMSVAPSFKPNSNSTSSQNFTEEPDFIVDCVPNFNGIEQLFYVFAFTRVIFFLVPMITGFFSNFFYKITTRSELVSPFYSEVSWSWLPRLPVRSPVRIFLVRSVIQILRSGIF